MRNGLSAYDQRHGWRGVLGRIEVEQDWASAIGKHALPDDVDQWRTAVVFVTFGGSAEIGFPDQSRGILPLQELSWARRLEKGRRLGPRPKMVSDVLQVGDVIAVEAVKKEDKSATLLPDYYSLRQIPEISGAIVVLDPTVDAFSRCRVGSPRS